MFMHIIQYMCATNAPEEEEEEQIATKKTRAPKRASSEIFSKLANKIAKLNVESAKNNQLAIESFDQKLEAVTKVNQQLQEQLAKLTEQSAKKATKTQEGTKATGEEDKHSLDTSIDDQSESSSQAYNRDDYNIYSDYKACKHVDDRLNISSIGALKAIKSETKVFNIIRRITTLATFVGKDEGLGARGWREYAFEILWRQMTHHLDTSIAEAMSTVPNKLIPVTRDGLINKMTVLLIGDTPTRASLLHSLEHVTMQPNEVLENWKIGLENLMKTLTTVYPGVAPMESDFAKQFADGLKPEMVEYTKQRNILFAAGTIQGAYLKAKEELTSAYYTLWQTKRRATGLLQLEPTPAKAAAATTRPAPETDKSQTCNYCHYKGHTEEVCRKKQRAAQEGNTAPKSRGGFRGRGGFNARGRGRPPYNNISSRYGNRDDAPRSRHRDERPRSQDRSRQQERPRYQTQSRHSERDRNPRTCHRCGKPNHLAKDCYSRLDVNGAPIGDRQPARTHGSAYGAQSEDRLPYVPPAVEQPKN